MVPAVTPRVARIRVARALDSALWRELRPALQLWSALLGVSVLLGVGSRFVTTISPLPEAIASAIDAAIIIAFCAARWPLLRPLFARPPRLPAALGALAAAVAVLAAAMTGWFWLLQQLDVPFQHYLDDYRASGWPLWSAFLLISVMPALFEELAFRGYIQMRLQEFMKPREALLAQAAMFSTLHLSPIIFVSHFLMGIVLGLLRVRTRSLYPSMVLHATWNAWVIAREM